MKIENIHVLAVESDLNRIIREREFALEFFNSRLLASPYQILEGIDHEHMCRGMTRWTRIHVGRPLASIRWSAFCMNQFRVN